MPVTKLCTAKLQVHFASLTDPRRRKLTHPFVDFIVIAICAVNGGGFTSSNSSIGRYAGGVGTATLTGGTWAESGNLTVGGTGTGTLNLTGGVLTVGGTLSTRTTGSLTISTGTLQVGTTTLLSNTFSGAASIASGVVTIGLDRHGRAEPRHDRQPRRVRPLGPHGGQLLAALVGQPRRRGHALGLQ